VAKADIGYILSLGGVMLGITLLQIVCAVIASAQGDPGQPTERRRRISGRQLWLDLFARTNRW
jgi:hypothetical protein